MSAGSRSQSHQHTHHPSVPTRWLRCGIKVVPGLLCGDLGVCHLGPEGTSTGQHSSTARYNVFAVEVSNKVATNGCLRILPSGDGARYSIDRRQSRHSLRLRPFTSHHITPFPCKMQYGNIQQLFLFGVSWFTSKTWPKVASTNMMSSLKSIGFCAR